MTSDRYILEIHRIPGSKKSPPRPGKIPVYLQHGLLDSSAGWVIMGTNNSLGKGKKNFSSAYSLHSISSHLGFILADLGYDVWLGNVRGNRYSRLHLDHDPDGRRGDRRRFWDFSWHQVRSRSL